MTVAISYVDARVLLEYSHKTGVFLKLPSKKPIGYRTAQGYTEIYLLGRKYYAHRLAWLLTFRKWPDGEIDHINGNRADNRLCNLRDVPRSVNRANTYKPRGISGVVGVKPNGKLWEATIQPPGKRPIHLGLFHSKEEAGAIYKAARTVIATTLPKGAKRPRPLPFNPATMAELDRRHAAWEESWANRAKATSPPAVRGDTD